MSDKLTKLEQLINLANDGLTREEFISHFKVVVEAIKKLQSQNKVFKDELDSKYQYIVEQVKNDSETELAGTKKDAMAFCMAEMSKMQKQMDEKLSSLKDGEDGEDADEEKVIALAIEQVTHLIPTVDQVTNQVSIELPQLGERIRDGLELLQGDNRLDVSAIKGLDDKLGSLQTDIASKAITYAGSGSRNFYQLNDVPHSYGGQAGKVLQVKSDESGLEFVTNSAGNVSGPASSVLNTLPRFADTTGKLLTTSGITVDNSNNITGAGTYNTATISGGTLSGGTVSGGTLTATAVNGVTTANIVVTSGSYADPAWITSLAASKITGTLGVANGGTGTGAAFTQGSVVFAGASGVYSQDNANFFYDATNHCLGLGKTTSLSYKLEISQAISGAASAIRVANSDSGVNSYTTITFNSDNGATGAGIYLNSTTRVSDGAASTFGIYNDIADVRLRAKANIPFYVNNTTNVMNLYSGGYAWARNFTVGTGTSQAGTNRLRLDQTDGTGAASVIEFYNGTETMFWFIEGHSTGARGQIRTDSSRAIVLQDNATSGLGPVNIGTSNASGYKVYIASGVASSGTQGAVQIAGVAHTGQTASTEIINVYFNLNATRTWAAGAITTQREVAILAPTYAFASASTITTAATLAISAAPIAGTNATITTPLALWVQGGATRFDGIFGYVEYDNGNSGTTKTIDWNNGNLQKLTLTGNVTLTFTAPKVAGTYKLKLIQDATGSRTVTWPSMKWAGAAAPTLTTTATTGTDYITIVYDGSTYFGAGTINFA